MFFILNSSQLVLVCKNTGACTVYSMPKAPYASMYVLVCVCSKVFSETAGPTEAKFHVEPQWDRGRKFIQMIPVICCSSFEYCQPLGAGAFRRAFTTNVAPQYRVFSRALDIEKLKIPLFRGPERTGDTNDRCITELRMRDPLPLSFNSKCLHRNLASVTQPCVTSHLSCI